MVSLVIDLVPACDTNEQGLIVYEFVKKQFSSGGSVTLDFTGIPNVTTSFVNSAFVSLLDIIGYQELKSRLRLVGVNRQIGNMVQGRMTKLAA